jgi:hypothetical protein
MIGGLLYVKRNSLQIFYNQTIWALIAIVSIYYESYGIIFLIKNQEKKKKRDIFHYTYFLVRYFNLYFGTNLE